MQFDQVTVIGGGLAGSECAIQLADRGFAVKLCEMRPQVSSPAHHTDHLAELVCSNSFKSTRPDSAAGLLKAELERMGSVLLDCAHRAAVPAGGALAVDRVKFSELVEAEVAARPNIEVVHGEVTQIPEGHVVIAAGPLCSPALSEEVMKLVGGDALAFFDAAAPIVARLGGRLSLIGTMLLHKGEVDGLIVGTWGHTSHHLQYIDQVIGKRAGVQTFACMNGLMLPERQVFIVDTHVNYDPSAEQLVEITLMAAEEMLRFGIKPKVALLSHSNFGSSSQPSAVKMRQTLELLRVQAPWLEVDGEMHGDVALDGKARAALMPHSLLAGDANLLVMPNIDAANISYNLLKTAAGGNIAIGPVLLGAAQPVHVLTPSTTVRRIVNMTALTVADANAAR